MKVGGERPSAVARDCGYKEPSGVNKLMQRLEQESRRNPDLAQRLTTLKAAVSHAAT